MNDRFDVRTDLINMTVERQLNGGLVNADDGAVRLYLHDILTGKAALVYSAGRYPYISIVIHDRQVAAAGGVVSPFLYILSMNITS